ncbi:hypothetical protein LCGC14_0613040 [marine sediment metagenome]|uniref:YspA cpYpsA-related SLOG domain-containing protein n=1 Tax=marine sediment metagenome TaxID=412755 RepID=A0A0F9RRE0_9ZZZZ
MKKIIIVGSRQRNAAKDYIIIEEKFMELYEHGDWIVSGGCPKGADSFAEKIARKRGIPILIFHAEWSRYGPGAGILRNTLIAETGNSLIACVRHDRKGGTEDTITKFRERHIESQIVLC